MKFEVYCDESGQEALANQSAHAYIAIGGIWMPAEYRTEFKESFNAIKHRHEVHGELKWNKVSPKFVDLYKEVLDFFFKSNSIRFRVVLIESSKVNNIKYNNTDGELGFYKFYYQLLHHWLYDFNEYHIYLDHKVNRDKSRVKTLKECLVKSNLSSTIERVQAIDSKESSGIQLADFLMGMVAAKFNGITSSEAKLSLLKYSEEKYLKNAIAPTAKSEEKFNIFQINLQGGW